MAALRKFGGSASCWTSLGSYTLALKRLEPTAASHRHELNNSDTITKARTEKRNATTTHSLCSIECEVYEHEKRLVMAAVAQLDRSYELVALVTFGLKLNRGIKIFLKSCTGDMDSSSSWLRTSIIASYEASLQRHTLLSGCAL